MCYFLVSRYYHNATSFLLLKRMFLPDGRIVSLYNSLSRKLTSRLHRPFFSCERNASVYSYDHSSVVPRSRRYSRGFWAPQLLQSVRRGNRSFLTVGLLLDCRECRINGNIQSDDHLAVLQQRRHAGLPHPSSHLAWIDPLR